MTTNPRCPFLPSPRIANAPTLYPVLTLSDTDKNTNWPAITPTCSMGTLADDEALAGPVSELQMSILIGMATLRNNHQYIGKERAELMRQKIKTQKDAIDFMGPERLLAELP